MDLRKRYIGICNIGNEHLAYKIDTNEFFLKTDETYVQNEGIDKKYSKNVIIFSVIISVLYVLNLIFEVVEFLQNFSIIIVLFGFCFGVIFLNVTINRVGDTCKNKLSYNDITKEHFRSAFKNVIITLIAFFVILICIGFCLYIQKSISRIELMFTYYMGLLLLSIIGGIVFSNLSIIRKLKIYREWKRHSIF